VKVLSFDGNNKNNKQLEPRRDVLRDYANHNMALPLRRQPFVPMLDRLHSERRRDESAERDRAQRWGEIMQDAVRLGLLVWQLTIAGRPVLPAEPPPGGETLRANAKGARLPTGQRDGRDGGCQDEDGEDPELSVAILSGPRHQTKAVRRHFVVVGTDLVVWVNEDGSLFCVSVETWVFVGITVN
jgi:hypothetical protein